MTEADRPESADGKLKAQQTHDPAWPIFWSSCAGLRATQLPVTLTPEHRTTRPGGPGLAPPSLATRW